MYQLWNGPLRNVLQRLEKQLFVQFMYKECAALCELRTVLRYKSHQYWDGKFFVSVLPGAFHDEKRLCVRREFCKKCIS